jgi:histidinol-phosphatase
MGELDDLALAQALAAEADQIARAAFVAGRTIGHEMKDDGSPVTAVDLAVEEALLGLLRRQRPHDRVIGEEVGWQGDSSSGRCWTLDGIDGTAGFVAGSPLWSTLIGFVVDGMPRLGVSTSTGQGRRWWAQIGGGAWAGALDGHGGITDPRSLRAISPGDGELPRAWVEPLPGAELPPGIARLEGRVRQVAMTTHPAKMVAAGDLDLAVMHAAGVWDLVPLIPLVNEAGGRCLDLEGTALDRLDGDVIFAGEATAAALPELLAP